MKSLTEEATNANPLVAVSVASLSGVVGGADPWPSAFPADGSSFGTREQNCVRAADASGQLKKNPRKVIEACAPKLSSYGKDWFVMYHLPTPRRGSEGGINGGS